MRSVMRPVMRSVMGPVSPPTGRSATRRHAPWPTIEPMTVFSASKRSTAVVPFAREAVWDVLRDATQVARLTPMVRSIEDHGSTWLWKLAPIEVLGKSIGLSFTERMELHPVERIEFTHAPQGDERAGVE